MNPSKVGRLLKESTLLFNCDIQSKFMTHVFKGNHVVNTARQMVQTAKVLDIPILVSEQNTKVFGQTVPELANDFPENLTEKFEKSTFSMINKDSQSFLDKHSTRKSIILFGAETHVCIQQTALDLISRGYDVHLLADGVSSINQIDRSAALVRLREAGAFITTFQSVVFELLKTSDSEYFKQVLPIIKLKTTDDRIQSL